MSMIIKRVKVSGGRVHVDFVNELDGITNELSMASDDAPSPDLLDAMNGLTEHALSMCRVKPEKGECCKCIGLSLSNSNGIMGAVITAQVALSDSVVPFTFSTPHKPAEPYGGSLEFRDCLTCECCEAIECVIQEAMAYIKGKRAQLNLGL